MYQTVLMIGLSSSCSGAQLFYFWLVQKLETTPAGGVCCFHFLHHFCVFVNKNFVCGGNFYVTVDFVSGNPGTDVSIHFPFLEFLPIFDKMNLDFSKISISGVYTHYV